MRPLRAGSVPIAGSSADLSANPRRAEPVVWGYGAGTGPLAVAHRGGAALGPENTAEAFQRALDMGFRYLETDVRMTRDGVCVAVHDRSLRRVTGVAGTVDAATWPQLQELTVLGRGRIPRLEELLHAWPDACWMLDLKQPSALPVVADIIRSARATHRVCLGGAWDKALHQARGSLGPSLTTALGWRALTGLVTGAGPPTSSADFAHVPLRLGSRRVPTPRLLERARHRGLRVVGWGVDTTSEMLRLLDDGVDGIITDRTDLLRDALIARGQWSAGTSPGTVRC